MTTGLTVFARAKLLMRVILLTPHPCTLDEPALLTQCDFHFTRRGGPGGQHRNKVSSAVVVTHRPTQILAEASERRDQSQNRRVAVGRLRRQLAWLVRQPVPKCPAGNSQPEFVSPLWRARCIEQPAKISPEHWDFPTLLAEALDHLHANRGEVSTTAAALQISTARLVKLFKTDRQSWEWVNRYRASLGLPILY
jgi:hypothetical protein